MLPLRARPAPASGVACAGMGAVMTPRMLNRSTRARQRLLARQPADVWGVVTDLVGLQAQNPLGPYIALAARVEGFTTDSLAAQVSDLGMVRLPLLRSTIHLVTDVDALALRPVLQDVLRRTFGSTSFAKDTATLDRDGSWRWGENTASPARGRRGSDRSRAALPGGVRDCGGGRARTWSGLSGMAAVVDRLRPQMRPLRTVDGRELLDLPDAPRPDPATPAPPRLLPEYDNVLLGHADRTRVIAPGSRVEGWVGHLLVDGMHAGNWRRKRTRGAVDLAIRPSRVLTDEEGQEVHAEAQHVGAVLDPNVG